MERQTRTRAWSNYERVKYASVLKILQQEYDLQTNPPGNFYKIISKRLRAEFGIQRNSSSIKFFHNRQLKKFKTLDNIVKAFPQKLEHIIVQSEVQLGLVRKTVAINLKRIALALKIERLRMEKRKKIGLEIQEQQMTAKTTIRIFKDYKIKKLTNV